MLKSVENHSYHEHDMIGYDVCHEVNNTLINDSCHEESKEQIIIYEIEEAQTDLNELNKRYTKNCCSPVFPKGYKTNQNKNKNKVKSAQVEEKLLSKSDWWYLVNQLEQWRVFSPRAVVKKNPVIAWRVMNLCKDPQVRVKGAYLTTCFRRECFKAELKERLGA